LAALYGFEIMASTSSELAIKQIHLGLNVQQWWKSLHDDLEQLRTLRNRIAHHEPIIKRSLSDDLGKIKALIGHSCLVTAEWMIHNQQVENLVLAKPSSNRFVAFNGGAV
jgi:hypothetical protein